MCLGVPIFSRNIMLGNINTPELCDTVIQFTYTIPTAYLLSHGEFHILESEYSYGIYRLLPMTHQIFFKFGLEAAKTMIYFVTIICSVFEKYMSIASSLWKELAILVEGG